MKNKVLVKIYGRDYLLATEESQAYSDRLADMLNDKLRKVMHEKSELSRLDGAMLVALEALDEAQKNAKSIDNIRSQIKQYVDTSDKAKSDLERVRSESAQLVALKDKENEELKEIEKAMDEPEAEEITDEIPVSELEEQLAQKEVITVSGRKPAYLFRKKTSELIPLSGIPFLLGKIPTACDYLISDNPAVSRIHAVIRYSEEEACYYIVDCGTTNNTYLNGKKIPKGKGVRLYDKDRLHLATEEFVFNHQN